MLVCKFQEHGNVTYKIVRYDAQDVSNALTKYITYITINVTKCYVFKVQIPRIQKCNTNVST